MENLKYIEKIESVLKELEDQGEIINLSNVPHYISKRIFHSVVEEFLKGGERGAVTLECDIPYLLEETAKNVNSIFSEDVKSSQQIVNEYYHRLLKRLSMREVAEFIHHYQPFEVALLSYYCVKLKNLDYRDFEYTEWRKKYYDLCGK